MPFCQKFKIDCNGKLVKKNSSEEPLVDDADIQTGGNKHICGDVTPEKRQ
jgi:hypothetical protein